MASLRNELLSKEEQEEEEMKNELLKAGFNESMNKTEMRNIYNIVKESKETSFKNQEISTLITVSDTKSALNTSNTSEHTSIRSNLANKITGTSSNLSIRSTSEHQLNNKEKSPIPVLNKSFEQNLNNENSSFDDEETCEKNFSLNDDFSLLREKCTTNINPMNGQNNQEQLPKTYDSNLERWRLNPLEFIENNNAVSLKQPKHLHFQQNEPSPKITPDSEIFEKLCQQMSEKLETLREHYLSDESSRTSNEESQWGSPVKVATNWNGSLDRNPFVENTPGPDVSTRDTLDRATKRKALCNIGAATYDSTDENSDDEFVDTKKRKCQQGKKTEEEAKKNEESQKSKASFVSPVEMIEVDDTKDLSDSDIFDNSNLRNFRKNSNTKPSINTESNYEQLQYPRRVPPPNPAKKNFKGPRAKKKNIIQSKNSSINKDLFLNDEEINKTLHELNEEIDDSDCVDITDEKKISPVPTHLQNKIKIARSYLETVHVAEEQKIKAAEEAKKQKEKEEELKKDELISKRLQEQEDENSRRIERERKFHEKEKFYTSKSLVKRITRSNFDKPRQTREDFTKDLLLSDDASSLCPICQKSFPCDQIETHASECQAFSSDLDEINNQPCSSRLQYECQICNTYMTYDGNNYEEHVIQCKKKAEDNNGIYV